MQSPLKVGKRLDQLRIARIVQYFQPRFGYADFFLATEFKRRGHEVCIVTSDRHSQGVKIFNTNVREVTGGKSREYGLVVYRLRTLFEAGELIINKDLRKVLKDFEPDIVHSNDLFFQPTLSAMHYKKKFGYALFVDAITGTFDPSEVDALLFRLFKLLFTSYLKKNTDGFFAVCEGAKKWLSKNFSVPHSSIAVVPLGADSKKFIPDVYSRQTMRKILGINDDEVALVCTGKILPEKDLDILIKGLASMDKNLLRKVRLLIVGGGPQEYLRYLIELAKSYNLDKNVRFIPTVNRDELPQYYNAADIAVWAGSPSISIVEAMSSGLPIIICTYPYEREDAYDTTHLLEYENGFGFIRGDFRTLAGCIERLMISNELRKTMGRRSRALVEDKLNWKCIAEQYLTFYRWFKEHEG